MPCANWSRPGSNIAERKLFSLSDSLCRAARGEFTVDYSRTVEVAAPLEDVWALAADIPAVAGCIPGVKDLKMVGADEFSCLLVQHVGSVKASFALRTRLQVDAATRTVITTIEGQDRALSSTVKATQVFELSDAGGSKTLVDIKADIQISGRIATFGHRII